MGRILRYRSERNRKDKKMKLFLIAFLAVAAVGVVTSMPFRMEDVEVTDEMAQYGGLLDLIPGVNDLIKKLTPIILEKLPILLDPNMDPNEKVNAIMEVVRDHAGDLVQILGDFGMKLISQAILAGPMGGLGR